MSQRHSAGKSQHSTYLGNNLFRPHSHLQAVASIKFELILLPLSIMKIYFFAFDTFFYLYMKLEMNMKIPNPSVFTIALSTCHNHLGGPYAQRFPMEFTMTCLPFGRERLG